MVNFSSSVNGVEKLNSSSYYNWSIRMQYYLLGQDLWDIVDCSNIAPPSNDGELRKWNIKAGKAFYVLAVPVEDELLHHIKSAKTLKEAWDNLAVLLTRTNDAKLQRLKNELLSISQQDLLIGHFARNCPLKRVDGNVAASKENDSEEVWDFQVSLAVEEQEELATSSITEFEDETALITQKDEEMLVLHSDLIAEGPQPMEGSILLLHFF
ncbi:hypothetical protein NL676_003755 [Syzygium grande]|nr:hypothetical protein NL676_003755 [Syzygium grande]